MTRLLALFLSCFVLSACAETQLAAHMVKKVLPSNAKEVGSFKVGNPYKIKGKWYHPEESYTHSETGIASWYGYDFHGKKTANGEIYDRFELTAAHRTLQMPSLARVTNLENGRSIVVRINDRGPFARGRIIDMSERGAELLGFKRQGTAKVRVEVLGPESKAIAAVAKQGRPTAGTEIAMNRDGALPREFNTAAYRQEPVRVASNSQVNSSTELQAIRKANFKPSVTGHTDTGRFLPDEKVATIRKVVNPEIYVQTASFGDLENARKVAQQLSYMTQTRIKPVLVNGSKFYRVQMGPMQSVENADGFLAQAIDRGYGDAIIVLD